MPVWIGKRKNREVKYEMRLIDNCSAESRLMAYVGISKVQVYCMTGFSSCEG